jgi:BMFP domain-containing protein YqiC
MLDPKQLDDLARRMAANMPKGVQVLQEDLQRGFRSTIEAGLGKLDLVTREEFDVQAAVLARTRAKLEALQLRVAELEAAPTEAPKETAPKETAPRQDNAPNSGADRDG